MNQRQTFPFFFVGLGESQTNSLKQSSRQKCTIARDWLCQRSGPTWLTPHRDEFARLFPELAQQPPLEAASHAARASLSVTMTTTTTTTKLLQATNTTQRLGSESAAAALTTTTQTARHVTDSSTRCSSVSGAKS